MEIFNIGAEPDDGTGDNARIVGSKLNANFAELLAALNQKAPLASPTFTGAAIFGASTIFNTGTRIGRFNGSAQFENILDNSAGRVFDTGDFPNISTVSGEVRVGRGTNTSGSFSFVIYRANGTATSDHQFIAGASGTLVRLARNGGAAAIGTTGNVDGGMGLDVRSGHVQVRSAAGNAAVYVSCPAGSNGQVIFRTEGSTRWTLSKSSSAESGGNAGSDLALARYDDAGASLGNSVVIARSTGNITVGGLLQPGADNTYALGGASNRWSVVYAGTGTINTSDAREKTPVRSLTPAEIAAAQDLAAEIGAFQWLASIEEKGEDRARLHVGLTVQRAIEIMEGRDLDPWRYGFICRDEITRKVKVVEMRTVTVQRTEEDPETDHVVEIRDGVPRLVSKPRPPKPVFRMKPLLDESGEPVLEAIERPSDVLDAAGRPAVVVELQPVLHPVPVMIEIAEPVEIEIDEPAGERLGFRYDQLALFILRGQEARLAALEA